MMLNAIQWTGGQEYANCVTFNEVKDLLTAAAADGNVTAAGNTALSAALDSADAAYRAGDDAAAATSAQAVRRAGQARRQRRLPTAGPRCSQLQSKGVELVNWMSGNETGAAGRDVQANDHAGHRRRHRAGDARADAGHAGDVRRVHAGRGQGLHGVDHGDGDLDRR